MATPTNGTVTAKTISVSWAALTGNENIGRDPLTNYKLQYNDGTGTWVDVTTLSTSVLTYTHTLSNPFPANADRSDYYVRYRVMAKNGVGFGIPSYDLAVVTNTYPR
jgi:hypothetical protein